MSFDEQPDGDIHGECVADFEALLAEMNRVVMESHKRLANELGINLADKEKRGYE